MKLRRERRPKPPTTFRKDCRTYALRGDTMWGDSITWTNGAPDGHEGHVHGWVSPLPRSGDRLLVKMASGKWGAWLFTKVEPCENPKDMFFADVTGALAYVDDSEVPRGACPHNAAISEMGLV